ASWMPSRRLLFRQRPIAETGHLFMMDRCQRLDLRRRQRLAPLAGLALAEEPLCVGGALDEAVALLLLPEHLERAELDGLVEPVPRNLQAQEGRNAAKRPVRRAQHVLVAHDVQARRRSMRPAHDVLRPGAIAFVAVDFL